MYSVCVCVYSLPVGESVRERRPRRVRKRSLTFLACWSSSRFFCRSSSESCSSGSWSFTRSITLPVLSEKDNTHVHKTHRKRHTWFLFPIFWHVKQLCQSVGYYSYYQNKALKIFFKAQEDTICERFWIWRRYLSGIPQYKVSRHWIIHRWTRANKSGDEVRPSQGCFYLLLASEKGNKLNIKSNQSCRSISGIWEDTQRFISQDTDDQT